MSETKAQELLAKLKDELGTIDVDSETRALLEELDSDIHELLNAPDDEGPESNLMQRAKTLETKFATIHPVAERFARELIDALARMGI